MLVWLMPFSGFILLVIWAWFLADATVRFARRRENQKKGDE